MPDGVMTALDLYPGWDAYQALLVSTLEPLTPDQLRFRTADHLRTVEETALHIIGARGRWSSLVLGLGDETTVEVSRWDRPGMPARSAQELVQGLTSTWAVLRAALAGWTAADLAFAIPNTEREPDEPAEFTRAWVIWHLVEHDAHHGGEITEILGTHGLKGLDL